ncbi:hypothetical protein BUE80_DR000024 [Diplocarpon rosae]|nr:hypothetical protein BUE80_DR000024 [Diplocarpon rosae]
MKSWEDIADQNFTLRMKGIRGRKTIGGKTITNPRNPPWIANNSHHDQTTLQVPRRFDHAFVMKSKRLKAYLIRTLNQALVQVEQWYPDNPSDDEMDWQHEEEIVVTRPQEVCYPWDTPCSVGFYSHVENSGSSDWLVLPHEVNGEGFNSVRMPCSGRSGGIRKEKLSAYDHRSTMETESEIV